MYNRIQNDHSTGRALPSPPIDIHTHGYRSKNTLTSYMVEELSTLEIDAPGWACAGIHPWEAGRIRPGQDFRLVESAARKGRLLAIGECGVDRLKSSLSIEEQKNLLRQHADLAAELSLPLVIHSVRAHADILSLKKFYKNQTWMIHGFIGNEQEIRECRRHGIRLSPGIALLFHMGVQEHKFFSLLGSIDPEFLFLESDGVSIDIEAIYSFYCNASGMDYENTLQIVAQNFSRDFLPGSTQ